MMRNFWIEVKIDGRKTILKGGPESKTGGFELTLYQRDKGKSVKSLEITGREVEGLLGTSVEFHTLITER